MVINPVKSSTGDDCHHDILNIREYNMSDKFEQAFIKPPNIFACCDGLSVQLTKAQFEDLFGFIENECNS